MSAFRGLRELSTEQKSDIKQIKTSHLVVCEHPTIQTRWNSTRHAFWANQNTKQWQDAQILLFWSIFTLIWSWGKYEAECDSSDGYSISLALWGNVFFFQLVKKEWLENEKVPRLQLESYPIYSVRSCGKIVLSPAPPLSVRLDPWLFLCVRPHGTDWQLRATHSSEPRQ